MPGGPVQKDNEGPGRSIFRAAARGDGGLSSGVPRGDAGRSGAMVADMTIWYIVNDNLVQVIKSIKYFFLSQKS